MRRIFFLCLIIICLLPLRVYSKRVAPAKVEPVIYEGVRYEAPTSKMGYVEAYDAASGKKLWEKKAYDVKYNLALERDVQDVFIKELKIEETKQGADLIVIDEQDRKYRIKIKEPPQYLPEMTVTFLVDKEGGMYQCLNADPMTGGCRYAEYIRPLLKDKDLKKLILIAERKYVSTPAFDQEFLTLLKEARENQKAVEMKRPCSDCKCKDGMTSVIYDYQDKEVQMKTSKGAYARGEKVYFTVSNLSSFDRYFQVVSAEKLIDGKWQEVIWNAVCGCAAKCDYSGYVEPGKAVTMSWDQSIVENGCAKAPAYPYRFVILDLYGAKDKERCEIYHSVIYSNVFQIRE